IKRLPVVRDGKVVGIVSRANLLQALGSVAAKVPAGAASDSAIRDQLMTELGQQPWGPGVHATVPDGEGEVWGVGVAPHQNQAVVVAAENIPGVKAVRSHLAWVDPASGLIIYDSDENAAGTAA